jgi:hypothetical protein
VRIDEMEEVTVEEAVRRILDGPVG